MEGSQVLLEQSARVRVRVSQRVGKCKQRDDGWPWCLAWGRYLQICTNLLPFFESFVEQCG